MAGRGFIQDVPPIYNEKLKCCVMEDGKMMTEPISMIALFLESV